jgi:TolB protein
MNVASLARCQARHSLVAPTRVICLALLAAFEAGCRDGSQLTDASAGRTLRPATTISAATLPAAANGRIAFESNRTGSGIYLMNPDGSGVTKLIDAPLGSQPNWSLDGAKLAFACSGEICVVNADGSERVQITTGASARHPSWSPDGSRMVFESFRDGNNEIYVMNADGSGQLNITNNAANDKEPNWSPDGTKIVFASEREGPSQIFVMNPDGTVPTRLTNTLGLNDVPAWSPDASKIVWHTTRDGPSHLWVMNADGSAQTRLTSTPANLNWLPAWSPDGTKIAFSSSRNGVFDIFVINADGSSETQLTNDPAADLWTAWQPIPDSDGDGVPGSRDLCPGTPTGASVDSDGCIPQQRIGQLDARIDELLGDGTLTPNQAAGLNDKLAAALGSIETGRDSAACGQLGALLNQVNALANAGALPPQTAAELRAAVSATRVQVGC